MSDDNTREQAEKCGDAITEASFAIQKLRSRYPDVAHAAINEAFKIGRKLGNEQHRVSLRRMAARSSGIAEQPAADLLVGNPDNTGDDIAQEVSDAFPQSNSMDEHYEAAIMDVVSYLRSRPLAVSSRETLPLDPYPYESQIGRQRTREEMIIPVEFKPGPQFNQDEAAYRSGKKS